MKKLFIIFILILTGTMLYSQGSIDGFGNVKWGNTLDEVKNNALGKITYTDEKKVLISKDGDIEYRYGFFHKGPENEMKPEETAEPKNEAAQKESRLFYVSVKFPYLVKGDVQKKIEEKYGLSTGEDIKNNKGAVIWDSEKTAIVMWVDEYEKKPFCMKINYYSKDLAKEVNEYQKIIFNSNEIEILKRLSL